MLNPTERSRGSVVLFLLEGKHQWPRLYCPATHSGAGNKMQTKCFHLELFPRLLCICFLLRTRSLRNHRSEKKEPELGETRPCRVEK